MEIRLLIDNGSTTYYPKVEDGIKWTLERQGTPGKLTFTVVKDETIDFQEGNPVRLYADGTLLFFGFVFKKSRNKDPVIDVTAYDQLRYLKNSDTYTEEGIKASELLQRIISDFGLNAGTIEDTGYTLETVVEEDETLFDIIQDALDETLTNTGNLFVLYDDAGAITLQNINSMRLDVLIDADSAGDYKYTSSIDDQTYNKIKLSYDNEETGMRELYIAQDSARQNDWGILQYFEEIDSETGASAKVDALLSLYDCKSRNLEVKSCIGDTRVRAGSAVAVDLTLGDIVVQSYMVVEKVTHTFSASGHLMDLTLIGGEFIA